MAFERNAPKAPSQTKKAVAMVLCAVALAAVLGYNWMSNPPRSASASSLVPDAAINPLLPAGMQDETPAQAIAKLSHDPTATLLRGNEDLSTALDAMPTNPFIVSPTWRASLAKSTHTLSATALPVEPTHTTATANPPHATSVQLNLQAIVKDPQASYAIINGRIVVAGMTLDGIKIVEISGQHILCQPVGSTESSRFELSLKPKAK